MSIDLPFGGIFAQCAPEQVTIDRAITASDCYLDDSIIAGRNGYRAATASPIGSGTIQALVRFRPSSTAARTVVVRGGHVYTITDPSSDTLSDGVATDLGLLLPTTANVSAAQMGAYLYLAPDDGTAWVRITPSFSYETVSPLPQPTATGSPTTPTFHTFYGTDSVAVSSGSLDTNYLSSGWYHLNSTANATMTITLASTLDLTNCQWLFMAVSPMSRNSNGVFSTQIEIGDNSGNYVTIGTTTTTDRIYSPNGIYCSVIAVPSSIRSAVKKIRLTGLGPYAELAAYGYFVVPVRSGNSTQTYKVTYYNSVLDQESELSADININLVPFGALSYPNLYGSFASYNYGAGSTASSVPGSQQVYNYRGDSVTSGPEVNDLVPFATITGTSAVANGTATGQANRINLYHITDTGLRLVTYVSNPGSGNSFSITDNFGQLALANASWIPSGAPPNCEALGAVGGRLITGGAPTSPARINISSYLAFKTTGATYSTTTDPFPRFPRTPVQSADGWAFDCSPTNSEQVLWAGNGDNTAYLLTSEAAYYMSDVAAPVSYLFASLPVKIWQRGAIGRNATCWAESQLFWAGTDGVYSASNRASVTEVTKDIRNFYRDTFVPDSTTVIAYQDRNLYVFCGTRFIRYNFLTNTWTSGTVAHTMVRAIFWRDPTGTSIQFWMLASDGNLYRWQNSATTDGGTAIPDWVYSSGFNVEPKNTVPRWMFVDTTGAVTVYVEPSASSSPSRSRSFTVVGESELAYPPDLKGRKWRIQATGARATKVNRILFEYVQVEARGG